jgi:AAA+ superfamily predicted ATPase
MVLSPFQSEFIPLADKIDVKVPGKVTVRRSPDETSAAALNIINQELVARNKKTAMLKALRLGQEQAEEKPVKKAAAKKKK